MDPELLKSNWALLAAVGIGLIIALIVLSQLIRRSAWGQLRETRRTLAEARQGAARALQAVEKAARIAKRLHERAEHTKPRHVQEANEVLEDARMLAKIANDKVLIAENHVRRVIHEEYPPVKQERLRKKYLPEQAADKRPFSF
jgi:hypothetical protein